MLQSRAEGDDEHFFSIALQIAAAEARQGYRTLAEDLREAVARRVRHLACVKQLLCRLHLREESL